MAKDPFSKIKNKPVIKKRNSTYPNLSSNLEKLRIILKECMTKSPIVIAYKSD